MLSNRPLLKRRAKLMKQWRAVEAIEEAVRSGATDWRDAIKTAAEELDLEPRTVERHWRSYLRARGLNESDYLFPTRD